MASLSAQIKEQARALGFDLAGIAPALSPPGVGPLREWLEKGCAGEMGYMARHGDARTHPRSILADVKSVVMVALNYHAPEKHRVLTQAGSPELLTGCVASYARGQDYHTVLRTRLKQLLAWLQEQAPGCRGRVVVDTAPLLERDFARLAGLGWFGKNTMLLNQRLGSFFFLGALLLDIDLPADEPFETNHCGTCTACLDACPTQAFTQAYELDARRCISYLTIELRGPVPHELRGPMGTWIFGCDICQDVCPWNRKAPVGTEPAFTPVESLDAPELIELLQLAPEEFRRRFRDTALSRPRRAGLLRNVAIALGNLGDPQGLPALVAVLADAEPLIRGAAAWALGKIGTAEAKAALADRLGIDTDETVRSEIVGGLHAVPRRGETN